MSFAPHLRAQPGLAADFAATLRAALPVIETARLVLRAPVLEDAPLWIALLAEDREGHMGGPFDAARAFAEFSATLGTWLLRGHGLWTVTGKAGEVLGFVLVGCESGDQEPELGFLFTVAARGQGYATEAAAAVRDHALGVMGLPSLVSYVAPGNHRSRALALRLGARLSGRVDGCEVWRHAPLPEGGRP